MSWLLSWSWSLVVVVIMTVFILFVLFFFFFFFQAEDGIRDRTVTGVQTCALPISNPWVAALATSGVIFAAVYLLWLCQRVIFGAVTHEANRGLRDLSPREWTLLVPVVVLIVWIGVYPSALTSKTEATIEALLVQVQSKANAQRVSVGPPPVAPAVRPLNGMRD